MRKNVQLNGLGELYLKGSDKMIDKERVKKLYLSGYNAVQIAKIISSKTEAVRKCIQRNFSELSIEHQNAVTVRKEAIKAINYESNRCMSDRTFIMKNRSAYITEKDGDIVLNRKVAPVVTFDTPRRLVNEFKVK